LTGLPADLPAYDVKQGNPHTQLGAIVQYDLGHGLTLSVSGNYFSEVYSGRLKLVELPEAYVVNGGLSWNGRRVDIRCEVLNMFDERYFRARTGDTLGDVLASSMPGRRWQMAFRVRL
jgi:outer membrane receptor protein involved in Fe transport